MLMEKYRIDEARLFGSYARGEATAESDIDLLLIGGQGFRPTDLHESSGKAVAV